MKQVAAVVVTYNRKILLKECIEALLKQTKKDLLDILIIDNHSTDGTREYIDDYIAKGEIKYINTGANLGGAGGFNFGMKKAVELMYEYIWVMDDDCLPQYNALEKLLIADKKLNGNYGWLSSVVLWIDGNLCKMNKQKKKISIFTKKKYDNLQEVTQSTFVSLFIKADKILKYGLPIKEFFIWGDDIEFTRRIAVRNKISSYLVLDSVVVHAMKANNGSDIATDTVERIERYKYAFRNEGYFYRKEGLMGIIYYFLKCFWNIYKIIFRGIDKKLLRCKIIFNSIASGLKFNPKIEYVSSKKSRNICNY